MTQLIKKAVFLIFISVASLVIAAPASAAYMVTLTNGATIRAEDYNIIDRKIELKMEGGSASFPRSLVASISAGGAGESLPSPSSAAKSPAKADTKTPEKADAKPDAQSPVPVPGTGEQSSGEVALREQYFGNGDSGAEPEEGVETPGDMTVGEFLDKEAEDGDDSEDAADQDGNSGDYKGFMPEDADPGDKVTEEQ